MHKLQSSKKKKPTKQIAKQNMDTKVSRHIPRYFVNHEAAHALAALYIILSNIHINRNGRIRREAKAMPCH